MNFQSLYNIHPFRLSILLGCLLGCTSEAKLTDTAEVSEPDEPVMDTGLDTQDTQDTQDTDTQDSDTQDTNQQDTGLQQDDFLPVDGPFLEFIDRIHVGGTNIWSQLLPAENGFYFSTVQQELIAMRRYSMTLEPITEYVMISKFDEFRSGIKLADHNMIAFNNALYFAASGFEDRDLVLIKTDMDGNRLGSFSVQVDGDAPTNDPQIAAINDQICLRWGSSGASKNVQCFNEDVVPMEGVQSIASSEMLPQLGKMMQFEGLIYLFSGDAPQRSLTLAQYDLNWNELVPFTQVLIPSENNDWNWFSSGVVYHRDLQMWFVAYTHMQEGQEANQESIIRLATFNAQFNLLDIRDISGPGYTRPHLALIGDDLILGYDNNNLVYLQKWHITLPAQ